MKYLLLAIKPGLKPFLYDFFDLLFSMILISSLCMGFTRHPLLSRKLVPWPLLLRFIVHGDCLLLPESVFNKAIKKNYDEKHKFKIELTPRQVRKLSELFRPVAAHATALPILTASLPRA